MTPGSAFPLLLDAAGGYQISRSLRFRASASAYLNRTPSSTGNQTTWTVSFWMKRGAFSNAGGFQNLFLSQSLGSSTNYAYFGVDLSNQTLLFEDFTSSVSRGKVSTVAVYRDPSAWFHVVLVFDTTNATAANRIRIYINGVLQSLTITTQIAQNQNGYMNTGSVPHFFCTNNSNPSSNFFDGYLAEVNFVDGQALTPSSFGQTDPATGVWTAKQYTGTYGTNGFYLNFSDNSAATAAAIGKDSSGNGNNWTPSNVSLTSGATYDSMIDTPTPYADGGNGRGNYCTLNSVCSQNTLSNANLTATATSTGDQRLSTGTLGWSTDKWYYEISAGTVPNANYFMVGLVQADSQHFSISGANYPGKYNGGWGIQFGTTTYFEENGVETPNATASPLSVGDIIQVAFDASAGKWWIGKNNTWLFSGNPSAGTNPIHSSLTGQIIPAIGLYGTGASLAAASFNFGQRSFTYTPPSGFKALNTQNLPTPTIPAGNAWFDVKLDTGANIKTTAEATFTGNELVWIKDRANANNHQLVDSVRGTSSVLQSNSTSIETTYSAPSGNSVGWIWKEGATPGFDIVTYTGPSSPAAQNVAHTLGVKPEMMIVKARNLASRNWAVYHKELGATQCLRLNLTNAAASVSTYWNNTEPTSTQFTVGTDNDTNANTYNYVAYLFAGVEGFSKFGKYTGNGSADGPFVFCGFRPRFILVKRTDVAGADWFIYDTLRNIINVASNYLRPNLSDAEGVGDTYDILSNGFKNRSTFTSINASGGTYIFAAFAENPFKYALAR